MSQCAETERVRIWCLLRDQLAHVEPVEIAFGNGAEFIYDGAWNVERLRASRPDLVLCVNDYHYDVARCLDAAREERIPSLTLQDGILEWRCQYENPLFGAGGGAPQHQPALADKMACLGHASARQIAAWGNAAKVEITGMPRLDFLLERTSPPLQRPGRRLLVMTAKNPGFTPPQREIAIQSLREVKACLDALPDITVLWRVSKPVAAALGVDNQLTQISSVELVSLLDQVDAVITSPSTAILEAMLCGRPVAALDYHNVPRFQPTAWTISARDHIGPVVAELLDPPQAKMSFQQDCLTNSLECKGPASERVRILILKMIAFWRAADPKGAGIFPPPDLLQTGQRISVLERPPLGALYPGQPVFEERNVEALQVRLARAENENTRLHAENHRLKSALSLVSWLRQTIRRLTPPRTLSR